MPKYKWTTKNSWDEIIERISELERMKFKQKMIHIISVQRVFYTCELKENIHFKFEFSIGAFWVSMVLGNGLIVPELIASKDFKLKDVELYDICNGAFTAKQKKRAVVLCMNKVEKYLENKQYIEDYAKLKKKVNNFMSQNESNAETTYKST